MIPCLFGSSASPLYGVYTPPTLRMGQTPCGAAVLLISPWGQENIRAHWFIRTIAAKLSDKGVASLRFDPRGCGDSGGEPSLAGWLGDCATAEEELRARSGLDKVVLFGMRFGATLAILAGRGRPDCPLIITWDPVLSGPEFLDRMRTQDETRRSLVVGAPPRLVSAEEEELRGYALPTTVVQAIGDIDLTRDKSPLIPALVLISSTLEPEYDTFSSLHRTKMAAVRREHFPESFDWKSDSRFSDLLIPSASIDSVVELIQEEIF